jgi:thiol-disulfide isomerase/thioredoxin
MIKYKYIHYPWAAYLMKSIKNTVFALAISSFASLLSTAVRAESEPPPAAEPTTAEPPKQQGVDLVRHPGGYVHTWIDLPAISGKSVLSGETINVKPVFGDMIVVVFMASWCETCQILIDRFKKLEADFATAPIKFVYVYSHDSQIDAEQFVKEKSLQKSINIMATTKILQDYHNPPLPSLYMSDRYGWMTHRVLNMKDQHVASIQKILATLTGY